MLKPTRTLERHLAAKADPAYREPTKHSIVDTYSRILELISVDGAQFIIRDVQHDFGENRAAVTNIWFRRHELERLRQRIDAALSDEGKKNV